MNEEAAAAPDEAKVFLSYSRKDRERASGIAEALRTRHFGVFKDTDDILPTEEWRTRLEELIEEADTIVFLLSPHSAASEVCAWEVEYATSLNKRIAPIVIEDVDGDAIPPLLARLNFIFCTPRDPFENAVDTLASALSTDIDWIREHTRLAGLARRWTEAGRPARLLLRGQDVADAESWRDGRPADAPAVTSDQAGFVSESRRAAGRRQRNWIMGSLAIAASAAALAVFAYFQSVEADRQRVAAEESAAEAERQRREVARRLAAQSLRSGDFASAAETLLTIDPDAAATKTVFVSLATPAEMALTDEPGTPFLLNGRVHFSTAGAPIPDSGWDFPATAWTPIGEDLLLVTDTGRARRVTKSGEVLQEGPALERSEACAIHRGPGGVALFSTFERGWALGSHGTELQFAPLENGPFTLQELIYSPEGLQLAGTDGVVQFDPVRLKQACDDKEKKDFSPAVYPNWRGVEPLRSFKDIRFPGPGLEAPRWIGERDQLEIQRNQIKRMDDAGVGIQAIENLRWATQRGQTDYTVKLADDLSRDDIIAFTILSEAAPQGGGTFTACLGRVREDGGCIELSVLNTVSATLSPDGSRMAVYGDGLYVAGPDQRSNLWLHLGSEGYAAYEAEDSAIISAAYAKDNRLAALTEGTLIVYGAEGEILSQVRRPGRAAAVAWAADDETLILLGDDGVASGSPETGFTLVPMAGPPEENPDEYRPRRLWIAKDEAANILALGYGDEVVIYDLTLQAPLTGAYRIPHPEFWDGFISGISIEARENGGFRLTVAGEPYDRFGGGHADALKRLELSSIYDL